MSRAIHFSHHSCGDGRSSRDGWNGLWRQRFGGHVLEPFDGCNAVWKSRHRRPLGRTSLPVHTTANPDHVTCKSCCKYLETGQLGHRCAGAIGELGHREMVKRTWELCCVIRGAAWPLTRDEALQWQRGSRSNVIREEWDDMYQLACHYPASGLTDPGDIAEKLRARAEQAMEEFSKHVGDAEPARAAISEVLLAAEWLEQVGAALVRASTLFEALRDRIEAGELDARVRVYRRGPHAKENVVTEQREAA